MSICNILSKVAHLRKNWQQSLARLAHLHKKVSLKKGCKLEAENKIKNIAMKWNVASTQLENLNK